MAESDLVRKKILIIEDNQMNRELLKEILCEDYDIIEASNGAEGLEVLKSNFQTISLVLLDVEMPVMNGYEFLDIYRSLEYLSMIPIIAISGSSCLDEEKCLQMGASDFITKPYIPNVVLRRVEALIRLRESISLLQVVKYDSLTKIFTKNVFSHYAEELLLNDNKKYNMLLVNIDDFSYLNDIYGEKTCDQQLLHVAKIISIMCQKGFIFGRINADRFAIMWEDDLIKYDELISALKEKLKIESPIKNVDYKFAYYEDVEHNVPVNSLINRLSLTIGKIRNQYNVNIAVYDRAINEVEEYNKFIIENMENSLKNGEFKIYYQPKHSAMNNEIVGSEALIRWINPQKGVINPGRFISIFEENGFITELDLFVLEQVCKDIRQCLDNNIKVYPVSVNASRKDFINIKDFNTVIEIIKKYDIPKELIHIEITESLCDNGPEILSKIRHTKEYGIKIELDDFGSGYSSLGVLTDIPMDYIKLDMKFARNIEKQKDIVEAIIKLAHKMNILTICEGVETKEQLEILKNLGCDYIQGFYYSKPLPYDEFLKYIELNKKL